MTTTIPVVMSFVVAADDSSASYPSANGATISQAPNAATARLNGR